LRRQLNAVASGAARLAAEGIIGAKAIVQSMRRRGIAVRPTEENPADTKAPEDARAPERK
jgi:hypothetical protein